jgi:uncharacterized membrane protein YfcA
LNEVKKMSFIPPAVGGLQIIDMSYTTYVLIAVLGFLGGILSGFFGSGGAFVMTPGMMSLGIPGINAVGGNIAHKFGKALMGSKRHAEMGHVDSKLGLVMIVFLLAGLGTAVHVQARIFEDMGKAASNLYISAMFIVVLGVVMSFMYRDIRKTRSKVGSETDGNRKKAKFSDRIQAIDIPPMIDFKNAGIRISLWFPAVIALGTGFLAGTIGVGGFIGVPGMIYLMGLPATVAAGTELFLAVFDGAVGAYLYTAAGFLDIRIPLLLYIGSMIGIQVGAIATQYVEEIMIKIVLVIVMATSIVSRAMSVPKYLNTMGVIHVNAQLTHLLDTLGGYVLYGGAIAGVVIVVISLSRGMKKLALEEAPSSGHPVDKRGVTK